MFMLLEIVQKQFPYRCSLHIIHHLNRAFNGLNVREVLPSPVLSHCHPAGLDVIGGYVHQSLKRDLDNLAFCPISQFVIDRAVAVAIGFVILVNCFENKFLPSGIIQQERAV